MAVPWVVTALALELRHHVEQGALSDLPCVDLGYGQSWPADVAARIVLADHEDLLALDAEGVTVPRDRWEGLAADLTRLLDHLDGARGGS